MNLNQLINMAGRMLTRKLMSRGMDAGIDAISRRGKRPEEMTPEEREAAKKTKQNAQKARRGLGMARRFMR